MLAKCKNFANFSTREVSAPKVMNDYLETLFGMLWIYLKRLAEISVLSNGLKFSPTPKELDWSQLNQDLEEYSHRFRLRLYFWEGGHEILPTCFKVPSKFNPKNGDAAKCPWLETYVYPSSVFKISTVEQEALKNLRSDHSIIIKPADEWSDVVA